MTNMVRSRRGGNKKLGKFVTSRAVGVEGMFIQMMLDGAKSNLENDMLVVRNKLGGAILLVETRSREKTAGKRNGRGEERRDVEDRSRGRRTRERGSRRSRRIRRHQSARRKRRKGGIT
jgi:hypothetical protein